MATGGSVKGLTVQIGAETKGLEAALKDVGKGANDINKELAQVEKGLKFDPGNTVLVSQKQELLKQKIGLTKQGLDALRQAEGRVEAMFKSGEIDAGQYRAFKREIATSESKLKTFEGQVKDTTKAQDKAEAATGKWGDRLKTGLKAAAVGAGIAVAGLVVSIGSLAGKALGNADNLTRLSDETGLSTTRLQELQYAADDLGVGLETITDAQSKVTKSMVAARKGTGDQADAYKALGISVVDSNGNLRDSKDVMAEALDALGGVGNETERDAKAMAIFGKSAMDLNPLIKAGGTALSDYADEAHATGAVISEEGVAALDEFGDQTDHVKGAILGAISQALVPLMPHLTKLMTWIASKIGPALQALGALFAKIWPAIQAIVEGFIGFLSGPTGQGIIKGVFKAVGAAVSGLSAVFHAIWPAIQSVVKVFVDWFRSPQGQGVIKSVMSNVMAIVKELKRIWEAIWPALGPIVKKLLSTIGPIIAGIVATVRTIITIVGKVIDEFKAFPGNAARALSTLWDAITHPFKQVWDWLSGINGPKAWPGYIWDWIKGIPGKIVSGLSGVWDAMTKPFKDAWNWIKEHVMGPLEDAWNFIKKLDPRNLFDSGSSNSSKGRVGSSMSAAQSVAGSIAAMSAATSISNSSAVTYQITGPITIDGSRMSSPDYAGLIKSIKTAIQMGG